MADHVDQGNKLQPIRFFVTTLAAIFVAELLVMFGLSLLPQVAPVCEAFLDAGLLSLLVVPFLYYLSLKPLHLNIEKRNQLRRIDAIKNEFISTAAHELRTPVATIMGYTEVMTDETVIGPLSSERRQEFLHEIYQSSKRLNRIVDDILDVGRMESGQKIPLNKVSSSPAGLLEKVVARFCLRTNHKIILDLRSDLPTTMEFDPYRIEQVMENLLDNAIKYSPEQGMIRVIAESAGNRCQIRVLDQGIGMSHEQLAMIFDKFYRADNSDTAVRGLGLGMGIVKQIVEDHGGTIRVDSQPGAGTCVCFTLPALRLDQS